MFHGWIIAGQWSTEIQQVHTEILIGLQNTAKFHVMSPRNACIHAATTRSFKFIFITFECRDKRLVSVSLPVGKTVQWIKKPRCPEVFCKKEVPKYFPKIHRKTTVLETFKKELQISMLYDNLLEQFPHISKANFGISFSLENIKTENCSF